MLSEAYCSIINISHQYYWFYVVFINKVQRVFRPSNMNLSDLLTDSTTAFYLGFRQFLLSSSMCRSVND